MDKPIQLGMIKGYHVGAGLKPIGIKLRHESG